uniref:HECT and RLD domain containing E3 ubiquitin protein ligase family member 6 n=1 Tax=Chelydra serpentina TaxID=8475 RepID=A0A8C3S695_CHESE
MAYCWGAGACGQLGLGAAAARGPVRCRPGPEVGGGWTLLEAACGERHTLLLRPDGTVCSCGANSRGQLGRKLRPGQRPPPQAQIIVHVSCGKEHSLAVCNRGKVFSWGAGSEGQLGTGEFKEQSLIPRKIDGLSALRIIQVTCGHYHSVALAQDGRVFSWGQNTHGQLGLGKESTSQPSPQHVTSLSGIPLAQVAAGGGHTFALSLSGVVYGWGRNNARQLGLNHQVFKPYAVAALKTIGVVYISCGDEHTAVLTQDGSVFTFGDDSAGQLGHRSSTQMPGPQKVEWIDGPVSHLACGSYHTLVYMSASGQVISFGRGPQRQIENGTTSNPGEQTQNFDISSLVSANGTDYKWKYVCFYTMRNETHWNSLPQEIIEVKTFSILQHPPLLYKMRCIFFFPNHLSSALEANCVGVDLQKARDVFDELTKKEWIVNQINYYLCADLIPDLPLRSPHHEALSIFLLLPVCSVMYKEQNLEPFVMRLAQAINSMSDRSSNILAQIILRQNELLRKSELPELPVFPLLVKRSNLVEDTLRKLSLVEDSVLKKQLLVQFEGELMGLDAGGVTLEFFLYVFEEMVNPQYGMFVYCDPASPMWFPTSPSVEKKKYFLFGILCGLSLFNRIIAFIPFPLAIFKKLLDKKPSLEDLKELSPVVGKMFSWFQVSWDNKEVDLIPDGSSVAVNNKNKKDFVNRYVDYVFNKSVEVVYEEFKRGFYKVLDREILRFFQPQELMEVAIGNANYDWNKFEKNAVYWGMYSPSHPTIKMFWKVFHELTLAEKKGFLLFLTGSDRIPVMGMDCIKIKFNPHVTMSEDHIPEAQTCFHILILPQYSTIEKLREKLLLAISNNRGFGKN